MLKTNQILKLIKEYGYMQLSDSDGACTCGQFALGGVHVRTHCHRTGECCTFSGVHIWQNIDAQFTATELRKIGESIAKKLGKDYMTGVEVKITTREKEEKLGYV